MSVTFLLIPVAISALGGIGIMAALAESIQGRSNAYALSTRMCDGDLLQRALEAYGFPAASVRGNKLDASFEGRQIIFQPTDDGSFQVVFVGDIPRDRAQTFVQELDDEYMLLVQQKVYENLLARARERGLILETEQVQNDNSVVLTFAVR